MNKILNQQQFITNILTVTEKQVRKSLYISKHLFSRFLNKSPPPNIIFLYSGPKTSSLGFIKSVITGDGFLDKEIDDKLEGTLALVKTVVVTG